MHVLYIPQHPGNKQVHRISTESSKALHGVAVRVAWRHTSWGKDDNMGHWKKSGWDTWILLDFFEP